MANDTLKISLDTTKKMTNIPAPKEKFWNTCDITLKNQKGSLYGATIEKCIYCSARNQCVTGEDVRRGYRTIEDDAYAVFRNAMRKKMQLEESKKIYRKRSGEVGPRFGNFKTVALAHPWPSRPIVLMAWGYAICSIEAV
jgi:hypothetical protein